MLIQTELKATLKRLRLSGMLATLPDRLAFARKDKLDYTITNTSRPVYKTLASMKNARWNASIGPRRSVSIKRV